MISDYKRQLWYGLFNPTPVLPLSWWWEYFEEKGMDPYFGGIRQINQLMLDASAGDFSPLDLSLTDTHVTGFGLLAGQKPFIYLFNRSAKSTRFKVKFKKPLAKTDYRAKSFIPDTGQFADLEDIQPKNGIEVSLAAKQDMILILD
jgi:hypothetical protein